MLLTPILLHYDNEQVAPLVKSHCAVFLPGLFGVPTITVVVGVGAAGVMLEHAPVLAALTEEAPCAISTKTILAYDFVSIMHDFSADVMV